MVNKTVKELSIWGNNISDDVCTCDAICKALRANNALKTLYMYGNPISGQTSKLIVNSLSENNTLVQLYLPSYPEDVNMEIISLQQAVIKKRKGQGCDMTLELVFT